jgi:hypothetical protein
MDLMVGLSTNEGFDLMANHHIFNGVEEDEQKKIYR